MDTTRSQTARSTSRTTPQNRTDRTSDERLVEHALEGNRTAFETLVRRHQRALVNHLYRLSGQREEAFDLAQEVFIKVYQSLASFDSKYRFTTWLYRIASNCAIDHLRRKQPHTCSLSTGGPGAEGGGEVPPLAGTAPNPDDVVQLRELEAGLERAIGVLPAGYRQLILLRHRHHCRYDEIARITGLPMGTVKNRIFRAREILKVHLADFLDREV